jgi:hypothetical protein
MSGANDVRRPGETAYEWVGRCQNHTDEPHDCQPARRAPAGHVFVRRNGEYVLVRDRAR